METSLKMQLLLPPSLPSAHSGLALAFMLPFTPLGIHGWGSSPKGSI